MSLQDISFPYAIWIKIGEKLKKKNRCSVYLYHIVSWDSNYFCSLIYHKSLSEYMSNKLSKNFVEQYLFNTSINNYKIGWVILIYTYSYNRKKEYFKGITNQVLNGIYLCIDFISRLKYLTNFIELLKYLESSVGKLNYPCIDTCYRWVILSMLIPGTFILGELWITEVELNSYEQFPLDFQINWNCFIFFFLFIKYQ
jgi:hypothetical protein